MTPASDTFTGWCVVPVKSRDSEPDHASGTWCVRYRYRDKLITERAFVDYASARACYDRVLLKSPGATLLERAQARCEPDPYPGNPQRLNAA